MISTIFFDLDGTLYPHSSGLWEIISERINLFLEHHAAIPKKDVAHIRQSYFKKYGTTLKGLQINHSIDAHFYLEFVHDIDLKKYIQPSIDLIKILDQLHQSKWVFTNSDRGHANRVLSQLEITEYFDGIIDVIALDFSNKPHVDAYQKALSIAGHPDPINSLLVDDIPANLIPASKLGMKTILVAISNNHSRIDHVIPTVQDLTKEIPMLLEYKA